VNWEDGTAVDARSALLVVQASSGAADTIHPQADGGFVLTSLAPGEYRVAVQALGYLPLDTLCRVRAREVDTLVLMLDAAVAGGIQVRPENDSYAGARPEVGRC
jgi:hypothetical protein